MERAFFSQIRAGIAFPVALLSLLSCPGILKSEEPQPTPASSSVEPEMILLNGGEFLMGNDEGGDFSPVHRVQLSPFHIDKYEVTNARYLEFCEATGHRLPEFWGMDVYRSGPDYPNHPVVGVSWSDAAAYARWRAARLPTEAEWEYSARGGLEGKNFSNSDVFDTTLYARTGITGTAAPMAVGSFPPNGFGLFDMTGNVVEWVYDQYDAGYYEWAPERNPTGPGAGYFRVIRGGGWHTGPYCSRVYFRNTLKSNWVDINIGFRCAKYVGESVALMLEKALQESPVDDAVALYRRLLRSSPDEYYLDKDEFNDLGYHLLGENLIAEAVAVFKLAVDAFPESYNAYDSLGEAYMAAGERDLAILNYRKSLELYPGSRTGKQALKELGVE
jgi:sulfatase modifying factor 1